MRIDNKAEWKRRRLRVKYWFTTQIRRVPPYLPLILFGISLFLSSVALLRAFSTWGYRPKYQTLRVNGRISKEVELPDGSIISHPVPNTYVEIGGVRTQADSSGMYSLEFPSRLRHDIPIVFRTMNQESVDRIDYPVGEKVVRKNFVFR